MWFMMRVSDPRIEHAYVQMGMTRIEIDVYSSRCFLWQTDILIDAIVVIEHVRNYQVLSYYKQYIHDEQITLLSLLVNYLRPVSARDFSWIRNDCATLSLFYRSAHNHITIRSLNCSRNVQSLQIFFACYHYKFYDFLTLKVMWNSC